MEPANEKGQWSEKACRYCNLLGFYLAFGSGAIFGIICVMFGTWLHSG